MSLAIGQNESYINQIENKKAFPSMQVFFYICEYLHITPEEFFTENIEAPILLRKTVEELKKLDYKQLTHITYIVKDLNEYRSTYRQHRDKE